MLTIEKILEIAKLNGATISKNKKQSGVGYTDINGNFHNISIENFFAESCLTMFSENDDFINSDYINCIAA